MFYYMYTSEHFSHLIIILSAVTIIDYGKNWLIVYFTVFQLFNRFLYTLKND